MLEQESATSMQHVYHFSGKTNNFDFLTQICPKMDLGPKIRKTNVGVRIRIVKMPNNLDFFDQNLPKNWFWSQKFKNLSLDSESASLRYYVYLFSDKTDNFDGFWGHNFKNLSLDSESASLMYYVHQFSDKTDNFKFLH